MFKTELEYVDFLGNKKHTTLRFNLTETELMDLARQDPTFDTDFLSYVVAEQNVMLMLDVIRKIISKSYGILSEDGNHFRKPPEAVDDFIHSAMYTALLEKLVGTDDVEYLKSFIIGTFPEKLASELKKIDLDDTTAEIVPITK